VVILLEGAGGAILADGRHAHDDLGAFFNRTPPGMAAVKSVAVKPGYTALTLISGSDLAYWTVSIETAALLAAYTTRAA
jgi:hypothetical protein